MNERIENLMYQAGITAQGCWDDMDPYDQDAILNLVELTIKECSSIVGNEGRFLRYDKLADKILNSFGVK